MTSTDDSDTGMKQRRGYTVAVSEGEFERMEDDENIQITGHTGMGPMSEFDICVSFTFSVEVL